MGDLGRHRASREPLHCQADSVTFGLYSGAEIRSLSTVHLTSPVAFNQLGHPLEGGLYDLRMGPYSDRDRMSCATCHQSAEHCPGHIGHIELPMPVINSLFYQTIHRMLKVTCIYCHRFRMPDYVKTLFLVQQRLLDAGLINAAEEAADIAERKEEKESKASKKAKTADDIEMNQRLLAFGEAHLAGTISKEMADQGTVRSVETLRKEYNKRVMAQGKETTCGQCGAVTRKVSLYKSRLIIEGMKAGEEHEGLGEEEKLVGGYAKKKRGAGVGTQEKWELNASELRDHFRALWAIDSELVGRLFPVMRASSTVQPTDLLFLDVLPVPPPRARPVQFTGGLLTLHPQSTALQHVIEAVAVMKPLVELVQGKDVASLTKEAQDMIKHLRGETAAEQLDGVWKELQVHVDHVIDRDLNASRNQKTGWGFKQLIERKQGLFRMHMMGKRVNHACRTVITPDPNIGINEIGLPEVFAKTLSYQVPVTPWNVTELREMVMNGPEVHPGAVAVEDEKGWVVRLDSADKAQREGIAKTLLTPLSSGVAPGKPKVVYRHLKNGDAMLLNRQPTLHRPGIMAHRARVLKGEKVMRLHYSNCKSYNADFDGDEMNAHFPQSELARAEAYHMVASPRNFVVPKDGTPLQGLIQDHVIAGVKMTLRGRFFERGEYQQLVYGALVDVPGRIRLLPPAIRKPKLLWSGKQVVSTIIINLVPRGKAPPNLLSQAKIKAELWVNAPQKRWHVGGYLQGRQMTESEVVIRDGVLCSGILDKQQYGATPYSLAHLVAELYGGESACSLLSSFSKLFTNFLRSEGFTLGVEDILVTQAANMVREGVMKETEVKGDACAASGVGIADKDFTKEELTKALEDAHRASAENPRRRAEVDRGFKGVLNKATDSINKVCLPEGLIQKFPMNNLQLMVNSGAKGSTVNTMQISCLLGQIELEGKRPPIMISGKSLPSFKAYDTQPRAGGFIDGRFMTGIQPQEFFFHCMAGREGLIDTACKTSRSGYLQRCLIKLLEGLVVNYDMTVRESDGSVIQFQYGEDSLDVAKSQFLKPGKLDYLADNMDSAYQAEDVTRALQHTDQKAVDKAKKKLKKWKKANSRKAGTRRSGFLEFCDKFGDGVAGLEGYSCKVIGAGTDDGGCRVSRGNASQALVDTFTKAREQGEETLAKLSRDAAPCPPPMVNHLPQNSHLGSITERVDALIEDYLGSRDSPSFNKDKFREMVHMKNQLATVDPGEPVGILAAQSVGEPSTQMTLNTFHFAGRGEMNVTLGIPRLREILMVASANIKTPSMDIPFKEGVTSKEMDRLRVKLNKVVLGDLLEKVDVKERIRLLPSRRREVEMTFSFLPYKMYKQNFAVKPAQILEYFETKFISKVFMPVLAAVTKAKKVVVETSTESEGKKRGGGSEGEDADERAMEAAADFGMNNESDDEDLEQQEGEGTDVSRKVSRQADAEYEEMEDEEIEMNEQIDRDLNEEYMEDDPDSKDNLLNRTEFDEGIGDELEEGSTAVEAALEANAAMSSTEARRRRATVLDLVTKAGGVASIVDYSYDTENQHWCALTLAFPVERKRVDLAHVLKQSAAKGVIHEVKDLKKAFIIEDKGKSVLKTDGINIQAMFQYENILDIRKLAVNNIHDMARMYGIEAANKTIVSEITGVFKVYGIEVDPRHLKLIADFMTFDGVYKPFNRVGMENNSSPLQQMTFETAMGFLRSATLGETKSSTGGRGPLEAWWAWQRMFGSSAFGSQPTGGFGQPATSTFGQPAQTTNMFGAQPAKPTFGAFGAPAQPAATGGLFGATSQPGGMFGSTAATPATNTFGAGAFGQTTPAFGASSAFKPAATGGFGATTTTQSGGLFGSSFGSAAPAPSGGLFGSTTQPTATFGGGTSAFGAAAPAATGFGGGLPAFGAQQDQPGTGHVKFNPFIDSDTMMKGGVQSQISTRHQCITCMKEGGYRNKSLEELRCEDYEVGRKGPGTGAAPAPAAGGMFGATQPAAGGMFGATASTASAFGQSTPNKPLFGTSGFGAAATTAAAPAFGGFGAQTSQAGGLFGAKPTAFGAPAATTAAPAFGFGSTTTQAGGMFGQPAKPFGAVAPTFGSTAPATGFGAAPASTAFGGFGAATAQPATSIGLFGSQPAKPTFGFGTSAPAATPGFGGGFGATSTAGGGLFGSAQPAKPAFGGFGTAAAAPAASTGFGGFGAASNTGGGLFGSTQAKPGFSFGGTSTAPATGFGGGFGAATSTAGGGLFGGAAKPGGLFAGTTTGFGSGAGFGATTGFGTSSATGFGAAAAPATAPPAAQSSTIQQHLLSLAASPYGENPLFKSMLSDSNRRQEVLKPTNPAAQKALAANTYKVSPHRNVKIRMKPKDDNDKTAIFEGLDDGIMAAGEIFIPRTSVKKLVLRSRPSDLSNNSVSIASVPNSEDTDVDPDKSLTIGLHEVVPEKKDEQEGIDDTTNVDDSFAALNPRKKAPIAIEEVATSGNESQEETAGEVEEVGNNTTSGAVVTLSRDGYYTIPPVKDLVLDADGNCMVTGFTIGREGYGNIHYPGSINVAGLNLDENVFIRHKEVIVYPDDTNKPVLGEGLNRKALITLDKVWPNDKSTGDTVRSPGRLRSMGYEEKLERASARLGARFIEYRPETGSWVFKVDHFSKYGLDDSDGEDNVIPDNVKKFKTLEKRQEVKSMNQALDNNAKNIVLATNDNLPASDKDKVETDGDLGSDGEKDVDMEAEPATKGSMVRSALFSDEMDTRPPPSFTKPVILQQRVASLTLQPMLIENIANSVLGNPNPYPTRGLGGNSSSMGNSFSMNMSSTLGGGSMLENSMPREVSKGPRRQLASYSLQGGYERFVPLATGGSGEPGTVVVPRYQDAELPLDRSLLAGKWGRLGDAGLVMSKAGRVGWGNCWDLVSVGAGLGDLKDSCLGDVSFSTLTNTTCGSVDSSQVSSLDQWFHCALSTSTCALDDMGSPVYAPDPSLDTLHEHMREALRQRGSLGEASLSWSSWVEGTAAAWQLMVALWGRIEAEGVTGEETLETHKVTMARRDALSTWLQQTVSVAAKKDLEAAKLSKSHSKETLANLSGGDVGQACAGLQARGQHRAALLVAQVGGGGEAARMLNQQLSRWTEVHADSKMAEEKMALFSLVAGSPVWEGTRGRVNTCQGLEWKRALANHLWYLTHPLSSVCDALHKFRLAWEGSDDYCQPPRPDYAGADQGDALDLSYLLIKLYTDRSTSLEDLLNPASHAPDQLDYRLSWFVHRVLTTLGYRHLPTHALERLHRDAASQAEKLGLWHWAAFVLCHLEEPTRRREAVESLLERNVVSLDEEREEFLVQELGLPLQWLARARATLARAEGRHKDRAEYLLQAERWQEAHDVIVKEIAPEAVIGQDYDYLHRLLGQLAPAEISEHIPGWSSQGQVYFQFISIERSVGSLLATRDEASVQYELERLRPSVSQLVRAVGTIPAATARERLAQSEIAKKVAHLMRAVHSVFEGAPASGSTARQLAESLSSLPLPEDYALQELRCLTRSYMREIA